MTLHSFLSVKDWTERFQGKNEQLSCGFVQSIVARLFLPFQCRFTYSSLREVCGKESRANTCAYQHPYIFLKKHSGNHYRLSLKAKAFSNFVSPVLPSPSDPGSKDDISQAKQSIIESPADGNNQGFMAILYPVFFVHQFI